MFWSKYDDTNLRMTLVLGPPGCGKSTFLRALAGKYDSNLRVSDQRWWRRWMDWTDEIWSNWMRFLWSKQVTGDVTYNGKPLAHFIPQRTCAYVSQHDLHHPEMTVRETLDFSIRMLGAGCRSGTGQTLILLVGLWIPCRRIHVDGRWTVGSNSRLLISGLTHLQWKHLTDYHERRIWSNGMYTLRRTQLRCEFRCGPICFEQKKKKIIYNI